MFRPNDSLSLAAAVVLAVSLATLAGAWAFQVIGGLPPCPMCLQQRWAYYAAVPLCLLVIVLHRRPGADGPARAALALCGLVILTGGTLAAFHAGVEWKWWEGPTTCSAGAGFDAQSSPLPDLAKPAVVPCNEAAWRLFGVSLAGYNALIALSLALACGWALARQDKR